MSRALLTNTALAAASAVVAMLAVFGVLYWHSVAAAAATTQRQEVRSVAVAVAGQASGDGYPIRLAISRTSAGAAGRLAVHLPDGVTIGASHASPGQVASAVRGGVPVPVSVAGGGDVLLAPTPSRDGSSAVIEDYTPRRAVFWPWLRAMAMMAVGGVIATGLAAVLPWRRSRPLVASIRAVTEIARTLGPSGAVPAAPVSDLPEINALVRALRDTSARMDRLVTAERDLVADMSHRLRTPLAALRLDSESIGDDPVSERVRRTIVTLGSDIDDLIRSSALPPEPQSARCDLVDVLRARMTFWSTLARHQGRDCSCTCHTAVAMVGLVEKDAAAVIDSLLGNVFQHTPPGTPFAATVVRYAGWVTLVIEDGGPGIADTDVALRRGTSGGGSTGLGLHIARQALDACGGTIHVERSPFGGARIRLRFGEAGARHDRPAPRAWRLWSGSADLPPVTHAP
jgi:signal transduction histidine kinase